MSNISKFPTPPDPLEDELGQQFIADGQEYFSQAHTNPQRLGCPPQLSLQALARSTAPPNEELQGHLFNCSPCFTLYRQARASRTVAPASRTRFFPRRQWAAVAASVCCAMLIGWFALRPTDRLRTETDTVRGINSLTVKEACQKTFITSGTKITLTPAEAAACPSWRLDGQPLNCQSQAVTVTLASSATQGVFSFTYQDQPYKITVTKNP